MPVIGAGKTVGGVAYIASNMAAPGVIKHTSQFHHVRVGHADKHADPQLDAFVEAGKGAKLDFAISENIERELWEKFIFLSSITGATAALRSPVGPIFADPQTRAFYRQLMDEAYAVGRARGVAIDPAYVDERFEFVSKIDPGIKSSMANDLERGGRLELDWLSGKVSALGRELNVPTPASDMVYIVLKLHRMGAA